jgi:predicted ribosomally synthesized peptide with SipW-like signal peptide
LGVRQTVGKKRFTSKTYLKVLIVVGLLAVVGGGAGTFASFNAEVTNPGNTFATGTLLLHNTDGVTSCTSESASSSNFNVGTGVGGDKCATLFNVPSLTDTTAPMYVQLTLTNAGTVDASGIQFKIGAACTTTLNSGPVTFGSGDLCTGLQFVIIETDAGFHHDGTNRALGCAYGTLDTNNGADGLGCTFDNTSTLATLPTTPFSLTLASGQSGNILQQLTRQQSRYFLVSIKPTASLSNAYQNKKVTFDLTWRIDQA